MKILPFLLIAAALPVFSAAAADPPTRRAPATLATLPAPAAAGPLRILLVDDDPSDNNYQPGDKRLSLSDQVFRKLAADAVGGDAAAWAVEAVKIYESGPGIDRLRKYSLILWYTGASYGGNPDNTSVLGIEDEKTVRRYLEEVGGVVVLFSPGYASKVLGADGTWEKSNWPFLSEVLGIAGGHGLAQRFLAGTVKSSSGTQFNVGKGGAVETQFSIVNPDSATVLFTTTLANVKGDAGTPVATIHSYGRGRIVYVGFTFENLAPAELAPAFSVLLDATGLTSKPGPIAQPARPTQRAAAEVGPVTVQVRGTPTTAEVSWTMPATTVQTIAVPGSATTARRAASAPASSPTVVVERLVPNAPAGRLTNVLASEMKATDPGPLTPGTAVTYRVTVTDSSGGSGAKEVTFTPPIPKDPENFTAAVQADGSIILSWSEVPGVTSYRISGPVQATIIRNATEWRSPRLDGAERTWYLSSVYEPGGTLTASATWPKITTKGVSNAGLPTPGRQFLTLPSGAGSHAESLAHFRTKCIDALVPDSLCKAAGFIRPTTNWDESNQSGDWEGQHFIPPRWPIAVFNDVLDLGVSRRVNCSPPSGGSTVCWAASYHPSGGAGTGYAKPKSLSVIIMANDSAFFGSWEWDGTALEPQYPPRTSSVNFGLDVEHYYAENGSLRTGAALDSQGRKGVPHACLSCHGGRYDAATGKVIGASLLPLVPARYPRSSLSTGGANSAQEEMRRINQIVLQSNPAPGVADLINAMYNGSPNTPNAIANDTAVPSGWSQQVGLYRQVVGPYCSSCHFAQRGPFNFRSWGNMLQNKNAVQRTVCQEFTMPHSEILFRKFWTEGNPGSLPGLLSTSLGFQTCRQ